MIRSSVRFASAVAMAALFTPPLLAGNVKVGVMGGTDADFPDSVQSVVNYLTATGRFTSVEQIANEASVATLMGYDAILFYTNYASDLSGPAANLRTYFDAGGGLVLATFLFQGEGIGIPLPMELQEISPFAGYSGNYYDVALGEYDASHPLFCGVSSLSGYYHDVTSVTEGTTVVGWWNDQAPLVAISAAGVVGITLFPPDWEGWGIQPGGDYATLFANALEFAATGEVHCGCACRETPEPSSLMLCGLGVVGLVGFRRRRTG
jgi:hypothetical protein